jgi:uncharacterized protein YndB with AHSA1/START domain
MTTTPQTTAVTAETVVEVPIERAFRVFTEDFDRIKPRDHTLLTVEIEETVLEPHVGGNIYDRGVDGSECRWARVLAFEPPHRLVFSWGISPQWQLETDPNRTSEVEIRFTELGPSSTRVRLEHRHLERHGDGWEAERDSVSGDEGWPLYLSRYAEAVAQSG